MRRSTHCVQRSCGIHAFTVGLIVSVGICHTKKRILIHTMLVMKALNRDKMHESSTHGPKILSLSLSTEVILTLKVN